MSSLFHPYQAFPKPVRPPPPGKTTAVCLVVDDKWLPYLIAAIHTLAIERTWNSDQVRAANEARNLLADFITASDCPPVQTGGIEMEDCMGCCIRVQDGHLQVLSCGEWQDVPGGDLTALIGATAGAPAPGGEVPPDETHSACMDLAGNSFLPLPVAVGPGFTIDVFELKGQWSDGVDTVFGIFDWYCPNGIPTLTGDCLGVPHAESGDPLPTRPHMTLIGKIDPDIVLDLGYGPVVIPSSATGTVLQLQANDSAISDNQGVISLCVKVTNGSSHTASLDLDTGSSASVSTPFSTVTGKRYKITVSGRGVVGSGPTSFDAFYYDVSGTPVRATTSGSACSFTNILELVVDDHEFSPIPAFASDDLYTLYLLGTGAPFEFRYCDSNYTDNHGILNIVVEEAPEP